MVLAYEAYVIHYASFSPLITSLFSVGGTAAAFIAMKAVPEKEHVQPGSNKAMFAWQLC